MKLIAEDDNSSTDSGSTVNTEIIMKERAESSKATKGRMFILIILNIIFSLIQIPIIYECE